MRLTRFLRRAATKPPHVVARRAVAELRVSVDRVTAPRRARRLDETTLLRSLDAPSLDDLWRRLLERPYLAPIPSEEDLGGDGAEAARVRVAAIAACARRIDLLGTGLVELGEAIEWSLDFKSGRRWAPGYAPRIAYVDYADDSDVKIPWELSRLHWLLPAGQAFALTGDECYAEATRDVIDEWIAANPYAATVNWTVAMEAALRIISWTWLFHACGESHAWGNHAFRLRFLRALYLHGEYVERHLEWSDVRGNHYTAGAAGLVIAGLFFGAGRAPLRWADDGWRVLVEELPLQVYEDGVDFEASTGYHRLVAELFLLPALYRARVGLDIPLAYRKRLAAMGSFTLAYTRPNGSAPAWGDDDDARALPLGGSALRDHRYLPGLIGAGLDIDELRWDLGGAAERDTLAPGPGRGAESPQRVPAPGCATVRRRRRRRSSQRRRPRLRRLRRCRSRRSRRPRAQRLPLVRSHARRRRYRRRSWHLRLYGVAGVEEPISQHERPQHTADRRPGTGSHRS